MKSGRYVLWLERKATQLRRIVTNSALEPLDPFALAERMAIPIFTPQTVDGVDEDSLRQLLVTEPQCWSGGMLRISKDQCVILLNPTHAMTRQRATLMEEISHFYLRHRPSVISAHADEPFRSYRRSDEKQAYGVAAAALLPMQALKVCMEIEMSLASIASKYGVSIPLVQYRKNITKAILASNESKTSLTALDSKKKSVAPTSTSQNEPKRRES